jgi:hypothetical protein
MLTKLSIAACKRLQHLLQAVHAFAGALLMLLGLHIPGLKVSFSPHTTPGLKQVMMIRRMVSFFYGAHLDHLEGCKRHTFCHTAQRTRQICIRRKQLPIVPGPATTNTSSEVLYSQCVSVLTAGVCCSYGSHIKAIVWCLGMPAAGVDVGSTRFIVAATAVRSAAHLQHI